MVKAVTPVIKLVAQTWRNVIVFKGSSIKTTQKFTVDSDNWKIVLSTIPGSMGAMNSQIYVNSSDDLNNTVAANIIGKGNDESYMSASGTYSLMINTAQNYVITIQEQK